MYTTKATFICGAMKLHTKSKAWRDIPSGATTDLQRDRLDATCRATRRFACRASSKYSTSAMYLSRDSQSALTAWWCQRKTRRHGGQADSSGVQSPRTVWCAAFSCWVFAISLTLLAETDHFICWATQKCLLSWNVFFTCSTHRLRHELINPP